MSRARTSQDVVEVLHYFYSITTTPTGAGVSQDVVEVLYGFVTPGRVSQYVVEVLWLELDGDGWVLTPTTPATGPAPHTYGHGI